MGTADWLRGIRTSYDNAAEGYAAQVSGALAGDPNTRGVLAWFAEAVRDVGGPVIDAGCGPGHITAHLHRLGVDVSGVDLSPEMVRIAQRDNPHLRFEVGTMTRLDVPDASLGGVLAFYSVVHVPDDHMAEVFSDFHRVLQPEGVVLVAFHEGDGQHHKTEGYGGHAMDVVVYRRPVARIVHWVREAGLRVELEAVTGPDGPGRGALVMGRKPEPSKP